MAHISLKKKVMAATVAMAMGLGATTVVAPQAIADDVQRILVGNSADDVMGAYEKLPAADLQKLPNGQVQAVWCIDYANRGVPNDMEVRKLTGQSGAYGTDLTIDPDIQKAAINVTKELIKAHKAGDDVREQKMNFILQGLLGNNLGYLNKVRSNILDGKRDSVNGMLEGPVVRANEFTQLTGFQIEYRTTDNRAGKKDGQTNYKLVKNNSAFAQVESNYKSGEYVTIVVPKGYTLDQNRAAIKLPQRYITVEQPGLEGGSSSEENTENNGGNNNNENNNSVEERNETRYEYHYNYTWIFNYEERSREIYIDNRVSGNWNFKVVQGGNLVTVVERDGKLVITPKDGAKGDVVIVITDSNGNTFEYKVTIDNTNVNREGGSNTTIVNNNYIYNLTINGGSNQGDKHYYIPLPEGGNFKIISGGENAELKNENGKLVIIPKPGSNGKSVVVEIRDKNGNVVGNATINITINTETNVSVEKVETGGTIIIENKGSYEFETGGNLVDINEEGGKLVITPKPGKNGQAVLVITDEWGNKHRYIINVENKVTVVNRTITLENGATSRIDIDGEWTHRIVSGGDNVTVTKNGNTLIVTGKDGKNGTAVIKIVNSNGQVIGHYTIVVTSTKQQIQVNEFNYKITDRDDFTITPGRSSNTIEIVEGKDLVKVERVNGDLVVRPKEGANGKVVIEEHNSNGDLLTKWNVTITPVEVKEIRREITTSQTLKVSGSNLHLVKGEGLVDITKNGNTWTVNPKDGAKGELVIEDRDEQGRVDVRYIINIKPVTPKTVDVNLTITNTTTKIIRIEENSTVKVIKGGSKAGVTNEGGKLIIKPKDGATGKIVIEVKNPDGSITNYVVDITQGKVHEHNVTITNPSDGDTSKSGVFEFDIKPGNDYKVVEGDENLVIIEKNGENIVVRPNDDNPGNSGKIVIEERDKNGNPVNRYIVVVEGNGNGGNTGSRDKSGDLVIIDQNTDEGSFVVEVPGNGGTITIKDGDKDVTGEFKITDNGNGTFTIIRKDGKPLDRKFTVTWTSPDGKTVTNTTNVNINIDTPSSKNRNGSSNPACIGAISLLSLPLLLAIPVGILSQVKIPGFEHIHGQLNAAIQQANTEIQRGLGIFDNNRAGAAANVNEAAGQIAPLLGAGAAAVGALAVIAGVGAGVVHACGIADLSQGSSKDSNGSSSEN